MAKNIGVKLDKTNIVGWVIGNQKCLKRFFEQKFAEIFDNQKNMLINDLNDEQSKSSLCQYMKNRAVIAKFMKLIKKDNTLKMYQYCLKASDIDQEPNTKQKFNEYLKNLQKKCKNPSESLTLKKQYEIQLQQTRKCFKLKATDAGHSRAIQKSNQVRSDDQKRVNAWKVNLPTDQVLTNFVCKVCKKNFINQAGLSMHQKACRAREEKKHPSKNKFRKISKKIRKTPRKGLRNHRNRHK